MSATAPLPLWAGRTAALLGIVLLALNLRVAVASISPIAANIAVDIPLPDVALAVLGMLPPIAFAVTGLTAPLLARRVGLELALLIAGAAIVAGHVIRGLAGNYPVLLTGSAIVFAGMGIGNILLPPVVKRYFPDRIALLTTVYVTLMSIGATVPALIAAPVGDSAGWRISLGMWAALAVSSVVPWAFVLVGQRKSRADTSAAPTLETVEPTLLAHLLRSRVAWAITLVFSVASVNAYAVFAWFPALLVDIAGVDRVQAGALLALFAVMGLPAALLAPLLAARMRNVGYLVYASVAFFVVGYLGLLFAPAAAPWLWVTFVGLGPLIFPVTLALINLRTRTHHTSIALSGFVQSIGYALGAVGPLVVGLLHDVTRSWTAPILVLLSTALLAAVGGVVLRKPRFVEDDLNHA